MNKTPEENDVERTINFSPTIGSVPKTTLFSPSTPQSSPGKGASDHHARDIPLIYSNLVQFEGCTRKQHRALAQEIRDNPAAYRTSTTCASELTMAETLYLAQVLEMWAHMSNNHRKLFVEMIVVESSIARINKIRHCDMKDARAILKQDVELYELSDVELDRKIVFIRNQSVDVRALMTTSVKYQAYYLPIKPAYLVIDRLTCGYAFAFVCVAFLCSIALLSWKFFFSMWRLR